ncbi:hypothetical protein GCM10011504_33840 [Siccirubricoccus deserti]|uniref:Uncharacterized protein n=1 Tax=Siccirubricoccus deserti TaxID=2013562 RepID=A0A9X0R221_9PROT|nr:hypothetical protein [Siccirubricoccus deserti]MBC4016877.1 hypothetical protein [Siccirubricoccus deserti]GGC52695.1 hypothetical protein GCM10011504_33840 [Siccirubricoccus deserti]
MQPHGFSVGQSVELFVGRYDGNTPHGAYTILRLLPNDGTDREYRVRHQRDGHERVVRESQLRPGQASFFR